MASTFDIRIDNVTIPSPSSYTFYERDLVVNSHRNAAGKAVWDVVRKNVGEIEIEWKNLNEARLKAVVAAIRGKKAMNIRFLNPGTGNWETRTFYAGDRAQNLVRFVSASKYWASLTVPFVEV